MRSTLNEASDELLEKISRTFRNGNNQIFEISNSTYAEALTTIN